MVWLDENITLGVMQFNGVKHKNIDLKGIDAFILKLIF